MIPNDNPTDSYNPGPASGMTIDYFCVPDEIADLEYSEQMYSDI